MDKTKLRSLIDEFADGCPAKGLYCSLKEFIIHLAKDPRVLVQIKCIEKFKYEKSKEMGCDIGWNGAGTEWVDDGWAVIFFELYSEDKGIEQLYSEIRTEHKKRHIKTT